MDHQMQHKSLDQQVIVMFGASSGIGRAAALLASERGATIVAAGRDRVALDSLAEAATGQITVGVADAADADQVGVQASGLTPSPARESVPRGKGNASRRAAS
jgi:NADP-dependent 3-hydroxy acid dehydrogenase YdfG